MNRNIAIENTNHLDQFTLLISIEIIETPYTASSISDAGNSLLQFTSNFVTTAQNIDYYSHSLMLLSHL